jgi:hypothetical protein
MIFKGRGLKEKHFDAKVNYIIDEFLVQGAITLMLLFCNHQVNPI